MSKDLWSQVFSKRMGPETQMSTSMVGGGLSSASFSSQQAFPGASEFYAAEAQIREEIQGVQGNLATLQALHDQAQTAVSGAKVKSIQEETRNTVMATLRKVQGAKKLLQQLQQQNAQARRVPGCEEGSAADRQRQTLTQGLVAQFKRTVEQFQELRDKMKGTTRQTVKRRVQVLTGGTPTEQELDDVMEKGNMDELLRLAVERQGDQGAVKGVLADISERQGAVSEVTQQLLALHELFLEMGTLVEAQQELLDNIETNVGETYVQIEQGVDQLAVAVQLQKNTRKWWIIGGVILFLIILIIIIVLVVQFAPRGQSPPAA